MKNQMTKMEDEVKVLKGLLSHFLNFGNSNANTPFNSSNQSTPLNAPDRNFTRQNSSNRTSLSPGESQKRRSFPVKYGAQEDDELLRPIQQQFNELLKEDSFNHAKDEMFANDNHESTIVQMEKDNIELRRELQDARASNKQADKKIQE